VNKQGNKVLSLYRNDSNAIIMHSKAILIDLLSF